MNSKVKIEQRKEAPQNDTQFRILFAAIELGEPSTRHQIANQADLSHQLVNYHMPKMLELGLLTTDERLIMPQPIFLNQELFKALKDTIINEALVQLVVEETIFPPTDNDGEILENIIINLLRLFTFNLKGRRRKLE
jgi:hypothetical protein|tara:strand:+ start:842 stop:1252 length:411 start_codon:yes stop_codon:yes gene_type:complete